MRFLFWCGALMLPLAAATAQRVPTSAAQAQQYERTLQSNPGDRGARSALLDYYFLGGGGDTATVIAARRRHILWLIENAPDDPAAGGPPATIDASGHALADPEGYRLASAAWRKQAAKPDAKAQTLVNAAYFFKLTDKDFTLALLDRAVAMQPANKEFGGRLGDEYALAIMGVTMINKNTYPLAAEARLTQSPAAAKAREALNTSKNPYALAKAGYMLSFQGSILYHQGLLSFDTAAMAEAALQRAVSLAPGDREVAAFLAEHRAIQAEVGKAAPAGRKAAAAPATAPVASSPAPAVSQTPAPKAAAAAPEAIATVSAADLKRAEKGMSRDSLLRLGAPSSRLTQSEDGHTIEVYQYYSPGGEHLGRVELTDGVVSRVQTP